jgi:hypothetical protein
MLRREMHDDVGCFARVVAHQARRRRRRGVQQQVDELEP